jgi:sugar (pentulose or hexulose) kinase
MGMILIFDIGKTNKKCFLFDEQFNIIEQEQIVFPEIKDEDGFPCDDLDQLTSWILEKFNYYKENYPVSAVNFSTYGASFVHPDKEGRPLTPLYNYLKPFDKDLEEKFFSSYGPAEQFEIETASPYMGFLNSGLQLYRIRYKSPEIHKRIKYSLHFPQYCSFLITGKAFSEYTSIGCHTALWDFRKKDYHRWVEQEGLLKKLAQVVPATHFERKDHLKIGVGIHDSSAALVPYLIGVKEKFMVISTGTWSIVLNPFNKDILTNEDLNNDCLQFLQIDGDPVKASRLFLGKEHEIQTRKLAKYFDEDPDKFKKVRFDPDLYRELKKKDKTVFYFEELTDKRTGKTDLSQFETYETAYHQLILELVKKQIFSFKLALGETKDIKTVFIDGGFSNNEIYCKILAENLPQFEFKKARLASGSALGAAVVTDKDNFSSEVFEKVLKIREV